MHPAALHSSPQHPTAPCSTPKLPATPHSTHSSPQHPKTPHSTPKLPKTPHTTFRCWCQAGLTAPWVQRQCQSHPPPHSPLPKHPGETAPQVGRWAKSGAAAPGGPAGTSLHQHHAFPAGLEPHSLTQRRQTLNLQGASWPRRSPSSSPSAWAPSHQFFWSPAAPTHPRLHSLSSRHCWGWMRPSPRRSLVPNLSPQLPSAAIPLPRWIQLLFGHFNPPLGFRYPGAPPEPCPSSRARCPRAALGTQRVPARGTEPSCGQRAASRLEPPPVPLSRSQDTSREGGARLERGTSWGKRKKCRR